MICRLHPATLFIEGVRLISDPDPEVVQDCLIDSLRRTHLDLVKDLAGIAVLAP